MHLPTPAWILVWADTGHVHGFGFRAEVVERKTDERRRRPTQKFVHRTLDRGHADGIARDVRAQTQSAVRAQAMDQRLLVVRAFDERVCILRRFDEAER